MLSDNLKVLLASTQSFAIKSQNFHWNVEGRDFPQYHAFFDTLYGDVSETIDPIAEYIRILGHYTPGSLSRYAELSVIQDQTKIPRAELMFAEALHDCEELGKLAVAIFDEATSALDSKTEDSVIQSIESLGGEITVVMIAHRLTTLKNCKTIIEIANGNILRSGNYEQIKIGRAHV